MNQTQHLTHYFRYVEDLKKYYTIFWICIAIFCIGTAFTSTYSTGMIKVIQLVQGLCIFGIVFVAVNVVQFKVNNDYLKILIILNLFWSIFILFHDVELDYQNFKRLVFGGTLKFFLPLLFFFPKNIFFYKKMFQLVNVLSISFIILNILFFDLAMTHYDENVNQKFTFEGFTQNLGIPAAFILFTFIYHDKKTNLLSLLIIILIIAGATYKARRAIMVFSMAYLMISVLIYYLYANKKVLASIFFAILLTVGAIFLPKFYMENKDRFFEKITERGMEDTRTGVEIALKRDFELQDWIIGRGINGKYWCPNIDLNDTTGYRVMIETEYLNIILKGGIIHLSLLLLLLFPAAILGLFYSKNLLSKASGIWILLWIASLYPLNAFQFDMSFLMVWVGACICYSQEMRNLTDNQLKKAFQ